MLKLEELLVMLLLLLLLLLLTALSEREGRLLAVTEAHLTASVGCQYGTLLLMLLLLLRLSVVTERWRGRSEEAGRRRMRRRL